jgi:hypothetical protein
MGEGLVITLTLYEALAVILDRPDGYAVFAKKPFLPDSVAQIGPLDSELSTPAHVKDAGFDYVIDTFSAQEAMEVFGSYAPSKEEVSKFLLHYSVHDAFPGWVYQVQGIFFDDGK